MNIMDDVLKIIILIGKFILKILEIIIWVPVSIVMGIAVFLSYNFHDKWISWTQDIWDKV